MSKTKGSFWHICIYISRIWIDKCNATSNRADYGSDRNT
jgi:hypothetical protein